MEKAEDGVLGRDGEQAWFELLTAQEWVQASTNVIWSSENFIHSNIMNHCAVAQETRKYPTATEIVKQDLANKVTGELLPVLVMSAEDMTEYNELKELIVDSVKSNVAQFILGNRDMSEWDDYCKELEKMNVERYVELAQAAYTEMTGN